MIIQVKTGLITIFLVIIAGCIPVPKQGVTVLNVVDGDTIIVSGEQRVRILGIDAPEAGHGKPGECGASEATDELRHLVEGKMVQLVDDSRARSIDRYGRRLSYVELDGVDVGQRLVSQGLVGAWYPASEPQPSRYHSYAKDQISAQKSRTGSWSRCEKLGRM